MKHTLELAVGRREDLDGQARWWLASPSPGWFRPLAKSATWLGPRDVLGTLEILGRSHELTLPEGIAGVVGHTIGSTTLPVAASLEPRAVGYGDLLAVVDQAGPARGAMPTAETPAAAAAAHGLVFRAPTSGRFYGRPTPDKPPFVEPGTTLQAGTTVCLLEVMKTFHRVAYSGATVRVQQVLVADGADVTAGDALLALDPV